MFRMALMVALLCATVGHGQASEAYRDSMQRLIDQLPSDSLKGGKYYNAARHVIERIGDLELYRSYCDSAMYYAQRAGHRDLEAKCHFSYGLLERLSGNYELALQHLDTNITYFEHDSLMKPYALFQVGVIHNELGNAEKSLETYLEILGIFEHRKDSFAMASTLNSIAKIYGDMERYDEAIRNFERANAIFLSLGERRDYSNTLVNISEIQLQKNDTANARRTAQEALQIAEDINFDYAIATALMALAKSYLDRDPRKALSYYVQAKDLAHDAGFSQQMISLNIGLGASYIALGEIPQALRHYREALESAKEAGALREEGRIYRAMTEIYGKQNNYEQAFEYQSAYLQARDSLQRIENTKTVNALQTRFETAKKDQEIAEQKFLLQERETALRKKQTQYSMMTGVAMILLVAGIMGWFLYQQRIRQRNQELLSLRREHQVKTLESLIAGEEKERLRIAKELHDGVNGDLSAIKYRLTTMIEHNEKVLHEVVRMLDNSAEQVRAISHNLVPPALEKFSLEEALENYCHTMDEIHAPAINFQFIGEAIHTEKSIEVNIYRIVQELVANALKHAKAQEITVQISHRQGQIQLTVEDNGSGFDVANPPGKGIGLENIHSRIAYLDGNMDLVSNEQGTSCTIEIDTNRLS